MPEFKYPIISYSTKGILKYARYPDDILKSNTHLLKKGAFEKLIIIDSEGRKYKVNNAKKNRPYGIFWGFPPFLYQNIIVDLKVDGKIEELTLDDFKKEFSKMYKKDAHTMGGIL